MLTNSNTQTLLSLVDITRYPETCSACGSAARLELGQQTNNDLDGVQWYQFCVNPRCINFDAAALREKRERLERLARDGKTFRRHQKRMWKVAIHEHKQLTTHQ